MRESLSRQANNTPKQLGSNFSKRLTQSIALTLNETDIEIFSSLRDYLEEQSNLPAGSVALRQHADHFLCSLQDAHPMKKPIPTHLHVLVETLKQLATDEETGIELVDNKEGDFTDQIAIDIDVAQFSERQKTNS